MSPSIIVLLGILLLCIAQKFVLVGTLTGTIKYFLNKLAIWYHEKRMLFVLIKFKYKIRYDFWQGRRLLRKEAKRIAWDAYLEVSLSSPDDEFIARELSSLLSEDFDIKDLSKMKKEWVKRRTTFIA